MKSRINTLPFRRENASIFGKPLEELILNDNGVPIFFDLVCSEIIKHVTSKGIFRKCGDQEQIELIGNLAANSDFQIPPMTDINTLTSFLKKWLRDLPESILTPQIIKKYFRSDDPKTGPLAFEKLSSINRKCLAILFNIITLVIKEESINLMSMDNLVICLIPSIIQSSNLPDYGDNFSFQSLFNSITPFINKAGNDFVFVPKQKEKTSFNFPHNKLRLNTIGGTNNSYKRRGMTLVDPNSKRRHLAFQNARTEKSRACPLANDDPKFKLRSCPDLEVKTNQNTSLNSFESLPIPLYTADANLDAVNPKPSEDDNKSSEDTKNTQENLTKPKSGKKSRNGKNSKSKKKSSKNNKKSSENSQLLQENNEEPKEDQKLDFTNSTKNEESSRRSSENDSSDGKEELSEENKEPDVQSSGKTSPRNKEKSKKKKHSPRKDKKILDKKEESSDENRKKIDEKEEKEKIIEKEEENKESPKRKIIEDKDESSDENKKIIEEKEEELSDDNQKVNEEKEESSSDENKEIIEEKEESSSNKNKKIIEEKEELSDENKKIIEEKEESSSDENKKIIEEKEESSSNENKKVNEEKEEESSDENKKIIEEKEASSDENNE
ncbi:GTPase activator activity protein [Tritrichomonas musculus]|uniref:GTPase activator activity protein n=1 Tax=Tritrichomonas musculus TaxID=1915356 RepID=A0ABR2ID83_9EUKA